MPIGAVNALDYDHVVKARHAMLESQEVDTQCAGRWPAFFFANFLPQANEGLLITRLRPDARSNLGAFRYVLNLACIHLEHGIKAFEFAPCAAFAPEMEIDHLHLIGRQDGAVNLK